MTWKMLDINTARMHGAVVAEDVIQVVCDGCPLGNLDFKSMRFCEAQTDYGVFGYNKSIEYNDEEFDVRCTIREGIVMISPEDHQPHGKDMALFSLDEYGVFHETSQDSGGKQSGADALAEDNN